MLQRSTKPQARQHVPLEVHASLVDSLHELSISLFIGSFSATAAALVTAWKLGSPILLCFAIAIAAVTAARVVDIKGYWKWHAGPRTLKFVEKWERRYVIGSAAHVWLLGLWCLACFLISDDPFVRLLSFSMVIANLIGTSGRNFASNPLVMSQIIGGGIPLSIATLLAGSPYYYAVFLLVLIPFFAGMKLISDRLRRILLDAIITAGDITQLAARFNTALNNMPHGLVMFDADRRLVVANDRFADLLSLPHGFVLAGQSLPDLMKAGAAFPTPEDGERVAADLDAKLRGERGELQAAIHDERWLAFTARPMESGGSVLIVEDVTDRRNTEERINRLARFDVLTGLPNRNTFHEGLTQALAQLRPEEPLAVLFVDLDEFKQVNDTLGHPAGDQLLCEVTNRLRRIVPKADAVARFGGDEFVIMQRPAQTAASESLARHLLESLSQPYEIEGHQVVIGASVGIAVAPRDGLDADLLLKEADMALYQAKAGGRAAWRFFDPSMDAKAQARRTLELDLREAFATEAFELHYQPLLDLRSLQIRTCEALIRWNHPRRGMVPPGEFIPVAEDIGIIQDIGDWVIRRACEECATWPGNIRVAVNLSSVQFRRPQLIDVVRDTIRDTGISAERLEIEITESVLLRDTPTTRAMLEKLVELGIRISLDDFGTGYSGLSYLHSFPLSKVKIDRSFLAQLHSSDRSLTLLRGVARLSAALGLDVVVEGIETEDQLKIVAAEESVDEVQGYLFSKPLPARKLMELLLMQPPATSRFAGLLPGRRARIQAA